MKTNSNPKSLIPNPKYLCLGSLILLALAFLFSCSNVESPDLPKLDEENPVGETWFWCVNLQENKCEAVSSLTDCSGENEFGAYSCPDNFYSEIPSSSSGDDSYDDNSSSSDGSESDSSSSSDTNDDSSSSDTNDGSSSSGTNNSSSSSVWVAPVSPSTGPVAVYGKLKASGKNIIGSKTGTTAVQVRGVSLGWSNTGWESARFFNESAVNAMVDGWKAEIIRVPMGYKSTTGDEYSGSYLADKTGNMARVRAAIDAAINKGVYVIIDWHAHDAHLSRSDALEFFEEMAKDYGSYDNVIFEIFNEPLNISWTTIKTYAESVIGEIRKHSDNLVLVGTPNWDQNVNAPVGNFLSDNNVAYVVHFYANSHALDGWTYSTSTTFQSSVDAVLNADKPVFVSEYGTVSSSGDGSHNAAASDKWMTYLNNNKISYCAWHVNNKNEASAFFVPTFTPSASANWTSTANMTASGQYIYSNLVAWVNNAPWRTGNLGGDNSSSSGTSSSSVGSSGSGTSSSSVGSSDSGTSSSSIGSSGSGNSSSSISIEYEKITYEGKDYKIVEIGDQVWMAENLNYEVTGSKCYGEGDTDLGLTATQIQANCDKYGRLYNWTAAKNACPEGWHLPENDEWDILIDMVGGEDYASKYLKSTTSDWIHYGASGLDEYGFAALPGGYGSDNTGKFQNIGEDGYFWSATEDYSSSAYFLSMGYNDYVLQQGWNSRGKGDFFSVRCLEDLEDQQ